MARAKDKEVLRSSLGDIRTLSGGLITTVERVGDSFADRADEFIAADARESSWRLTAEDLELTYPQGL